MNTDTPGSHAADAIPPQVYRELVRCLPRAAVVIFDRDMRILLADGELAPELGLTPDRVEGMKLTELFPCEVCDVLEPACRASLDGETVQTDFDHMGRMVEARLRLLKTESDASSATALSGMSDGFGMALLQDVTEARTLRAEAMRSSRLASLGELAGALAKEMSAPLTSMINYAQVLADECDPRDKALTHARQIIHQGRHITTMVRGMTSFASVDWEVEDFCHPLEVVQPALDIMCAAMEREGVDVEVSAPGELGQVLVRPRQIEQALLNLLHNALHSVSRKHPLGGGHIRIEITPLKEIDIVNKNAPGVRISVSDNGEGISPRFVDKVRRPFFSTKSRQNSSGLGLSLAEKIVQEHGGALGIESEEGRYCTVWMDLPTASAQDVWG